MPRISLLKSIQGPWEHIRGNLLKDLEKLQAVINGIPDFPTYLPPRRNIIVTSAYPSIDTDSYDFFAILRLDSDIESFTMNLKGSPVPGQILRIRIQDDGTVRNIVWGDKFADSGAILPTATSGAAVYTYISLIYNEITLTWDCI